MMTTLLFFMYYYQSKPTTAKKKTKHIHINKKTDVEYFCLEEVNEGEDLVILRCGGHVFHKNCILHWIRKSPSCPTCRGVIGED